MTEQRQPTAIQRVDTYVEDLMTRDRRDALIASLPQHVKPERFERNLIAAVNNHPKLLNCDPQAVFNEVAKAGALGLYLDPTLGEAYLITGWSAQARALVPQLRLGYRGMIKLSRQSGEIATVYAHAVHENDPFEVAMGTDPGLVHRPDFFHERGGEVLYYAVVKYRDGTQDFEPMTVGEINAIRDRSDGYRAWLDKKISSTPWATDYGEMAKKTVLRRLMKRLPQSPEIGDALKIEDQDFRDAPAIEPPSLRAKLPGASTGRRLGYRPTVVDDALAEPVDDPESLVGHKDPIEIEEAASEAPEPAEHPSISHMTADQRAGWVHAFRAKIMKVGKNPDACMAAWKVATDDLEDLKACDEALYVRLHDWMDERQKRLKEAAGVG